MERVHFNNIKKKIMSKNREAYLASIIEDIKKNYLVFYEQLENLHCNEKYPEWEKIEYEIRMLVKRWLLKCIDCYIVNVRRKIKLYKKAKDKFILEDMKELATVLPLKKNKYYLANLLKAKEEM